MLLDGTVSWSDTLLQKEEGDFSALLNAERKKVGAPALKFLPSLQLAAVWMARDMGVKKYFNHYEPNGRSPWDRMLWCGYNQNAFKGENIAAGYTSGAAVFQGWKDSPGHYANMISKNYKYCGLARVTVPGSPYTYYWVQDFASVYDPTWTGLEEDLVQAAMSAPSQKTPVGKLAKEPKGKLISFTHRPPIKV